MIFTAVKKTFEKYIAALNNNDIDSVMDTLAEREFTMIGPYFGKIRRTGKYSDKQINILI